MKETDAAYIAGLFDGEGHVVYKQYPKKRKGQKKAYPTWKITLEMNMTEESIIRWVHEVLGVGTVCKKPPSKKQMGRRMQWRWRCSSREAYKICCMMFPYSHVKLPKIQKIIDHYQGKVFDGKVVDLDSYRMAMALE